MFVGCFISGRHSETFRVHAEADRLRHIGRGHDHGAAAQQPQAAGEAHHGRRDRNLRRTGAQEHEELGVALPRLPLRSLPVQQSGHSCYAGAHLQERPQSRKRRYPPRHQVDIFISSSAHH